MDRATRNFVISLLAIGLALYVKFISSGSAAAGDSIDGLAFPGQLKGQTFVGGGTRAKYGAVKVYAVGLYIDAGRAASSLKPFVGLPAEKLPSNFFKVLQTGKFDRTLLLQFHRAVAAETVAGALRDSLAGRLSAAVLDKFRSTLLATLVGMCGPAITQPRLFTLGTRHGRFRGRHMVLGAFLPQGDSLTIFFNFCTCYRFTPAAVFLTR